MSQNNINYKNMQLKDLQLKRMLRSILLILLLSAVGMPKICAYDFSAVCSTGQTLYYNITDEENLYVTLTFPGENGWLNSYFYGWSGYTKPTGDIILPESVQYGGLTYTVTSIGSSAFYDCSGLTANLTIPNSVTSIGYRAFSDCSGFTGVLTIPNSVTLIEYDAFRNCSGFTEVHFNATKAGPYGLITNSYSPFNGCGDAVISRLPPEMEVLSEQTHRVHHPTRVAPHQEEHLFRVPAHLADLRRASFPPQKWNRPPGGCRHVPQAPIPLYPPLQDRRRSRPCDPERLRSNRYP